MEIREEKSFMIADAGRGEYCDLAQRRGERGENSGWELCTGLGDVVMMGAAIISAVWIKTIRGEGFFPARHVQKISEGILGWGWSNVGEGGVYRTIGLMQSQGSEGCQPNTPAGSALRKTSSNVTI